MLRYFTGATMRGLAAGAMVGIAVVSAATPVLAAPSDGYPGPPMSPGMVSSSSVSAGQTVLFSGGGFQPATTISVSDNAGSVGSAVTSDQGIFVATVPVESCGPNVLTGGGAGPMSSVTVASTVTGVCADRASSTMTTEPAATLAGGGPTASALPRTGSDLTMPGLAAGFGLVVAGTALTVAFRRRRKTWLTANATG